MALGDHLGGDIRHGQSLVKFLQLRKALQPSSELLAALPPASTFFVLKLVVVALTEGFFHLFLLHPVRLPWLVRLRIQFHFVGKNHEVAVHSAALLLVALATESVFPFWTFQDSQLVGLD